MEFKSDNTSAVVPEIFTYLAEINTGYTNPYGEDEISKLAREKIANYFDLKADDITVYFVSTGTAANSISLTAMARQWQRILCTDNAHVTNDECNTPQVFAGGMELESIISKNAKFDINDLKNRLKKVAHGYHVSQVKAITVTQPTELGTVYSIDELKEIFNLAKEHNLKTHMDGARFFNAIQNLNCKPADITHKIGLDVLSLGATKNGAMSAEAIVVFNQELNEHMQVICKSTAQTSSKMRYLSAQWIPILDNIMQKNAENSNNLAEKLTKGLSNLGIKFLTKTITNQVFPILPHKVHKALTESPANFYDWSEEQNGTCIRLVTSWTTTEQEVNNLISIVKDNM